MKNQFIPAFNAVCPPMSASSFLRQSSHMKSYFFWLIILVFPFLTSNMAHAQNVNQMNFSTVNVDNLNDQQIRQFMQQVQQTGYNADQIDRIALAKGMKPAELQKLKARIAEINAGDSMKVQSASPETGKVASNRDTSGSRAAL